MHFEGKSCKIQCTKDGTFMYTAEEVGVHFKKHGITTNETMAEYCKIVMI